MLEPLSPDTRHVRQVGLLGKTDREIWNYAKSHGFAILTRDKDFRDRSFLEGHPPKVIVLRVPNGPPARAFALVESNQTAIRGFLEHPVLSCLLLP